MRQLISGQLTGISGKQLCLSMILLDRTPSSIRSPSSPRLELRLYARREEIGENGERDRKGQPNPESGVHAYSVGRRSLRRSALGRPEVARATRQVPLPEGSLRWAAGAITTGHASSGPPNRCGVGPPGTRTSSAPLRCEVTRRSARQPLSVDPQSLPPAPVVAGKLPSVRLTGRDGGHADGCVLRSRRPLRGPRSRRRSCGGALIGTVGLCGCCPSVRGVVGCGP